MKIESVTILKIELEGASADNFKSAIKKVVDAEKKIGFKDSSLSIDERECLDKLSEKIK